MEVPFEAVGLSGLDDRLPDLLEGQNLLGSHCEHWHRRRERKRLLWLLLPAAMTFMMIGANGWQNPAGYLITLVGFPVFIAACFAVYCLYSRQWFVVPGGVVVCRRFLWFAARSVLRICTPADSTLFICPETTDWSVHLCSHGRVHAHTLGDRECMALLAAWQSPLRPPPLDQLEMLR
ncbi:MAG TPA: hypothetical protein PKK06_12015 [Phycisphaerae bacterium]|nr:hypothetical protein [Phycisphaerae bacterium]HNU45981.1 hypothetical protein [Phycisphaerae bacterium]